MSDDSRFDIKKFLLGPFTITNYAKVLVFAVCLCVIAWIGYSSYYTVKGLRTKPTGQSVQTNAGTLTQIDSHEQVQKKGVRLGIVQFNS